MILSAQGGLMFNMRAIILLLFCLTFGRNKYLLSHTHLTNMYEFGRF